MTAIDAIRRRGYATRPGAPEAELGQLLTFCPGTPDVLLDLLRHTNGLHDEYDAGVVWPASEIIERNRAMRSNPDFPSLYWSFEQVLFIGEDGGGNLFAFRVLPGYKGPEDVYSWNHEDDSRTLFAPSLAEYLSRRP
jgi:hypothetical protein